MSQNSKARPGVSLQMLFRQESNQIDELYSLFSRKGQTSSALVARPLGGTASSLADPLARLATQGDTMIGPIAFDNEVKILSLDHLDISRATGVYKGHVLVAPQSGVTDDLTFIDGVQFEGQWLLLQGAAIGNTITIKNSGNIETTDGADFSLVDQDMIIMVYSTVTNKWRQVTRGKQAAVGGDNLGNHIATQSLKMGAFGIEFGSAARLIYGSVGATGVRVDVPVTESFQILVNNVQKYNFGSGSANFNNNSIINLNDILFQEAGQNFLSDTSGLHLLVPTGDVMDFLINGITQVTINSNAVNLKGLEFVAANRVLFGNSGISGVRVDVPTGESFQIYVNGVEEFRFNNANLEMNNNSIISLNDILFNEAGQSILSDTLGLHLLVPTGDNFSMLLNGVEKMRIDSLGMILNTAIDMNSFGMVEVGSITMSDVNMIINDTANVFSVDVGSTQDIQLIRGGVVLLHLASTSILRSDSKVLLRVTGSGDTIVFNDNTSDRLTYDWTTDDFYPVDGQSNLGRSGNRWAEVFAVIGTINTSFTKFKKNIQQIDNAQCLDICKKLEPIKFKWDATKFPEFKDKAKEKDFTETIFVGFNADALKQHCPEAVRGEGVVMNSVIGMILGAIRNLDARLIAAGI